MIYNGSTGTPDPVFLDVAKIDTGTTDICAQIQQAWTALGGKSGVLDARSITGTVTCGMDPFSNATEGILLLGNVLIQTSVPWQIPSHVWVNGLGDPGSFTSQNTVLQAASNFMNNLNNAPICASNALVCLGHGSQAFRAQVSNMAIDCNNVMNCGIAAYNGAAQEGSWFQGVTLANASVAGLMVSLTGFTSNNQNFYGAVNSGPYHNVSVQYWEPCSGTCNPVGVLVQNVGNPSTMQPQDFGGVVRDFDNFTVSAFNACPGGSNVCPGTGFLIEGASVNITNSHVEYYSTAVQIGANNYSTNGVEITNMYLSNTNSGTGVMIWKPTGTCTTGSGSGPCATGDVTLSGINYAAAGTGNSLVDQVGGNTLGAKDLFIAFYAVGHAVSATSGLKPRVISTSPNATGGAGTGGNPH
jgi:hypothetical protein